MSQETAVHGAASTVINRGAGEYAAQLCFEEGSDASFELLLRRELGLYTPEFKLLEYHTTHRQHGERSGGHRH